MIALWTFLGRPAARSFVLAMTLSVLSSLLGIALLGLSGWFLAAAAAAGASGASYAFNHLYPSTGVRTIAVGRVASRYAEQLVGHEATLEVSAAIRPLVFERIARAQRAWQRCRHAILPSSSMMLARSKAASCGSSVQRLALALRYSSPLAGWRLFQRSHPWLSSFFLPLLV